MTDSWAPLLRSIVAGTMAFVVCGATLEAGDRALTFEDLMQFRQIRNASISEDGTWIAYALVPDRGDGEAVVRSTTSGIRYRIERGADPVISADGRWVAAAISPTLEEREKAERAKDQKTERDDAPKDGMSLLDLATGDEERTEKVEAFAFSDGGRWLAFKLCEEREEVDEEADREATGTGEHEGDDEGERELGTTLTVRDLATGDYRSIEYVTEFAFAETSAILAYAVSAPGGEGNGVFARTLDRDVGRDVIIRQVEEELFQNLVWADEAGHLAFVVAGLDEHGEPGDAEVWIWQGEGEATRAASKADARDGWTIPAENELTWSEDGRRLFFGFKPIDQIDAARIEEDETSEPFNAFDFETILDDREVDVWHWKDPRIIPNQKERWEEYEKDRVYLAVFHLDSQRVVPLADLEMPDIVSSDNSRRVLGESNVPYLKEITWDGEFSDLYVVDLETGDRQLVARRLAKGRPPSLSLSPNGRFVIFFDDSHWHLYDARKKRLRNVTAGLDVGFANEDHDYPMDPPGYGLSEWLDDSSAIFIYDKYDIWRVPTNGEPPTSVTAGTGRTEHTVFRVVDLDPEHDTLPAQSPLLLEGYHDLEKHDAFYSVKPGGGELRRLYGTGRHRLQPVARAERADRILFRRERYDEFPDLWLTDARFQDPERLSAANPQIADFAWGVAELVEWRSADGIPLQGVLIKPGNYQPGTRYPVLVYFYRFFSDRLNLFNEPVVNHRPSFPVYASNGYAVFLPDIRFEIGRPGLSATKCLVPGVQKLIDMGVADPDAVGLHGHSWSGYQTAFVITQTDIFAAAVAGAPVANMTSAYSGIRLGTGLARQFQYEKSQSRIGGSLWEYPERYMENSPVFFADKIDTPLLIQFGDEDDAVPWPQGIELYLACRRLGKSCIMLQYRGEPHHLKKYANKLDYSIKMKEFFDHWLKGEPAPTWMTEGVPYSGR